MIRIAALCFIFLSVTVCAFAEQIALSPPPPEALYYHSISNWVWGISQISTLMLLVVLVISGLGARISNALDRFTGGRKYLTLSLFVLLFFVLDFVVHLPLMRFRNNAYNNMTGAAKDPVFQWIGTQTGGLVSSLIISVLTVLLIRWLITKSPRYWWLWGAVTSIILVLALFMLEPQFKNYQTLGTASLEVKIAELAARAGVPRESIVIDTSPDAEDAHVIGLGPVRLMILGTNLLNNWPESWVLQTVAHETKHFVKDDNLHGFYIITVLLFIFFWLMSVISSMVVRKLSGITGISAINQPASFLILYMVFSIIFLASLPPINRYRQYVEFEADRFGLEMNRDNVALAQIILSWSTENKFRVTDPSLFYNLFRNSHPPDVVRLRFANEYFPWRDGKASKYEKDFKAKE